MREMPEGGGSIDYKGHIRAKGGGRKKESERQPGLIEAIKNLVEPHTMGDPERPLIRSSKSSRKLSSELKIQGFEVSHEVVRQILLSLGYSLQSNKKTKEGGDHPDRNAQFKYINADGGGSNGSRNRLWKEELQRFSNNSGLEIHVSHYPPGTSKWNKIEHRLFAYISKNWRAKPLETLAVIVNLIGATTTTAGLMVKANVDETVYETGIKISDQQTKKWNLERDVFHGEWNYIIKPNIDIVNL